MAAESVLTKIFAILESWGFFDIIAPFFIAFSLAFMALQSSKLFLKNENDVVGKRLTFLASVAFGFYVTTNSYIVSAMKTAIPTYTFVLFVILAILLLFVFATSGKVSGELPLAVRGLIGAAVIIIVGYIYLGSLMPASIQLIPSVESLPAGFWELVAIITFLALIFIPAYYIAKG